MVSREHRYQNRLPPKVLSRKKTGKKGNKLSQRRKKPWYRHTPWIVSLAACGVFIVLIGGVFGVRQVVILVRGSHSEVATENNGSPAGSASQKQSADPELAASLESSEPGLEVLPPKAAMQPGRKLPRMLLVGPGQNMFSSLEEALQHAIGGDIVEIRTNGPLYLEPGKVVWEGMKGTLTIRGGRGFQPIITRSYSPTTRKMLNFSGKHARVVLRNLTFVIYGGSALTAYCPIDISDCCFVGPEAPA